MLRFNVNAPPFDNLQVRKAASFAAPFPFSNAFLEDNGLVENPSLLPPDLAKGLTTPYPKWVSLSKEERLKQAEEIMTSLGYSAENRLKITLSVNNRRLHERMANVVKSHWESVYFDVEIDSRPWAEYLPEVLNAANFQVARSGWGF